MRVSPLLRLTAFLALLVFAAGWSEDALVLHPCPHHAAISHMSAQHGHGDAHHAAAGRQAQDGQGMPAHSGPCSCIIACAGTAYALAAPPADVRLSPVVSRSAPLAHARARTALPGRPHHVLPFPTAPPVLLS